MLEINTLFITYPEHCSFTLTQQDEANEGFEKEFGTLRRKRDTNKVENEESQFDNPQRNDTAKVT